MHEVAILTFHRACNYGAFLQAYALQETLNNYENVNAYILDYRSDAIEGRYASTYCFRRSGNPVKKICKFALDYRDINKRNVIFSREREKHYRVKSKDITKDQLASISTCYQAIITGSDQVWNRDIVKDDNSFFLDFVNPPVKKYSYAASIGKSDLSPEQLNDLANVLSGFSRISVREPDAVAELEQGLGLSSVMCTLDPVFLFEAKKWRDFSEYKPRKPYVLFFMMGQSGNALPAMNYAKKYAKAKGLDMVFLSDNERWYKFRDLTHYGVASPAEFVGLIDHAECVITNSFHATAFSIILHKDFYVETQVLRSNRIVNLLKSVSLEKRGLMKGCPQDDHVIDWENVDAQLRSLIDKSYGYLDSIVSDLTTEAVEK